MRTAFRLLTIIFVLPVALYSQNPLLKFEVASVKPSPDTLDLLASFPRQAAGRLMVSLPLRSLIGRAFVLENFQILGGPSSMMSRSFDINAKAERPDATPAQMNEMLKSLLAERFQLKGHTEMRDGDITILKMVRSDGTLGPSLKPSSLSCPSAEEMVAAMSEALAKGERPTTGLSKPGDPCARSPQEIAAGRQKGQSISTLVLMLGLVNRSVVQDRTGLTGRYDWELAFDPRPLSVSANAPSPTGPPLLTAMEQQLGIRVERTRGPVEFLVIDAVEFPTSD